MDHTMIRNIRQVTLVAHMANFGHRDRATMSQRQKLHKTSDAVKILWK